MDAAALSGIGLGWRFDLADQLLDQDPSVVSFIEVHPENYVRRGGAFLRKLEAAKTRWPVLTHGLTCGFGQTSPIDAAYRDDLVGFLRDIGTPWHSEHLCFGGVAGTFLHDLLPFPFNAEARAIALDRYGELRDALSAGHPEPPCELAFENISYYAPMSDDPLEEARFCRSLIDAGAKIMLDVNNVYVNSLNLGFDPRAWLAMIPAEAVLQIHVAGSTLRPDGLRVDTHGAPIDEPVYALLGEVLERTGPRPVLLERDTNIPPLPVLLAEVERLREVYARAMARHASAPRAPVMKSA